MKKLQFLVVLTSLCICLFGFSQEPNKMQQVLASHEAVMEKMPELVILVGKLQSKADTTHAKEKYQTYIDSLKSANQAMMSWMQGFGERFTTDEMMKGKTLSEEKKVWLLEEEQKIETVRKKVDRSIDHAKKVLQH